MSVHEVNTEQHSTSSNGMNHVEGGWPADVEPKDKDHVSRYKKRIQKEENFLDSLKSLGEHMETFLMENNSVNIYEEYFSEENESSKDEEQFKTLNVFRDSWEVKRKVLDISWSLDGSKIAGAYSASEIPIYTLNFSTDCYIWDVENCNVPHCTLEPEISLRVVEFSPRDLELLLGGYSNGQIGLWDARTGGRPQQITASPVSHKEGVSDISWITSKTGLEFYSAATDGKLYCWDSRDMSSPIQSMPLDPESNERSSSYSITCLEYDPTLPHRFMVGTDEGLLLSCNRKYKDPSEMISSSYISRSGPVLGISRNAFFPKLFASCSTYGVEVWSEDLTESSMINLKCRSGYVTDAVWSHSHPSFLLITKSTGYLELWDILVKHHDSILSVKLETEGLTCLNHKQQSNEVACGTPNGCIHLMEIPGYSAHSLKAEKNFISAMIDREGKRERTIEAITREQRAREKNAGTAKIIPQNPSEDANQVENYISEFTSDFDSAMQDEEIEDAAEEPRFDLHFSDNVLRLVLKDC